VELRWWLKHGLVRRGGVGRLRRSGIQLPTVAESEGHQRTDCLTDSCNAAFEQLKFLPMISCMLNVSVSRADHTLWRGCHERSQRG